MRQIVTAEEIMEFNGNHNTPSELMMAVTELSPYQTKSLALDLVWKLATKDHQKFTRKGVIKRAILEAYMRPVSVTGTDKTVTENDSRDTLTSQP